MKIFLLSLLFAFTMTLGLPGMVVAYNEAQAATATFQWDGKLNITNNTGRTDIAGIASKLITWLLAIIALVSTIMIIYAGLLMVLNAGNEARIRQAKSTLIWAIIGLVVAIGAFAIVTMIQGVLS